MTSAQERRPWVLEDALVEVTALSAWLHGKGWLVGLYGSVLTAGAGNDLDMLVVASWPHTRVSVNDIIAWYVQRGWRELDRHVGATSLGVSLQGPGAQVIDLRFTEPAVRGI